MEYKDEIIKIYSSDELSVLFLKDLLEQDGITSMIKNDFQEGIVGGFGGGVCCPETHPPRG